MVFMALDPKAAAGIVGVVLAFMGGCGAFNTRSVQVPPGSISGTVQVEGVDTLPASSEGWVVQVEGGGSSVVSDDGRYTLGHVTPGYYNVVLQPPSGEVYFSCNPAGCQYNGVQVAVGTATMRVDFQVYAMPAPPF